MDNEIRIFENYVKDFDKSIPEVEYKYNHTYRVVSYAKQIADSLNLSKEEYNRASICALFHDIGRFPQIRDYDTYSDLISIDHGDKGYEILNELGYDDEIVKTAVKYHNKKEIPKFDELTDLHCKLVRDADKLDIMLYFMNKEIDKNILPDYSVKELFKEHKLLDNKDKDTDFEEAISHLVYIFDINYNKSIEILLENNYIETKLNNIRNENNKDLIDYIDVEIKKYIKERFDIIC